MLMNVVAYGHPDISPALNGILGGLVSITAGCAYFEPYIALIVGFLGGCLVYFGSWSLRSMKIDDALDAAPVHMLCGAWGVLATGLLASPKYIEGPYYGCFYGGSPVQLGIQVAGMVAIFTWSASLSGTFFYAFKHLGWLRVGFDEEVSGLDKLMNDGALERDTEQQFQPAPVNYYVNQQGAGGGSNELLSTGL
jgi:Amt family ammonium transporter